MRQELFVVPELLLHFPDLFVLGQAGGLQLCVLLHEVFGACVGPLGGSQFFLEGCQLISEHFDLLALRFDQELLAHLQVALELLLARFLLLQLLVGRVQLELQSLDGAAGLCQLVLVLAQRRRKKPLVLFTDVAWKGARIDFLDVAFPLFEFFPEQPVQPLALFVQELDFKLQLLRVCAPH